MPITPTEIIATIDRAAESKGDGKKNFLPWYVSDFHWGEVTEILEQVTAFNNSGKARTYPKAELLKLFNRGYDVIDNARPSQHAGMGIRGKLDDLRSELVVLASNFENVSAHRDLLRGKRKGLTLPPPVTK
jgi:hypothetical protein